MVAPLPMPRAVAELLRAYNMETLANLAREQRYREHSATSRPAEAYMSLRRWPTWAHRETDPGAR